MEKRLFLTSAQPVASECRNLHAFGFQFTAGNEVCVHAVFLIDPGYFIVFAEVVDSDKFLFIIFTYKSKN